jgi:hypothetical protein
MLSQNIKLLFIFALTGASLLTAPKALAGGEGLNPAALGCYKQAMSLDSFFTMNKKYKLESDIEKLAVMACTYSDAVGSLRCYEQAKNQDAVLKTNKNLVNIFGLEQKYARLCSNSGQGAFNKATGDADAIDCFKAVMADTNVLTSAKQYMEFVELEDLAVKLCISSNGLGATTCYKKSLDKAEDILKSNQAYKGKAALDQIVVDLCKGSRLR